MNSCGLTDSIASTLEAAVPCPCCGASARLVTGMCVSCLLREALISPPDDGDESLQDLLAEVDVCDSDWRVGSYDILEEIGRGGMGVIYKARQSGSRRIVALKRVLSYHSDSSETLVRFRREAEAVASLDHPNILPIYDVGEVDGLPFFTMKFAPGGSLQSVKKALREDPRQCVSLLERVARAVHHAHEQGILHRDLKPGNILLDGWREPMVSDFGLAKWLEATSDLTRTLTIFGTPGYIAPEQAGGPAASLKPAADIYSLGAILFDLLTGRPPFLGEHALAVMRQAADKPAPALRTIVPTLDRELETICAKCLEREPDVRYATAETLADDLQRWLAGQPIVATPVGLPARAWRWARRNPLPATAVAGLFLISGAALVREGTRADLRTAVQNEQLLHRSVAVLPTLQLDSGKLDTADATTLAESLQSGLSTIKPARVVHVPAENAWTASPAGLPDVKEANRKANARLVVASTSREVNGRKRLSVRLINGASGQLLRTQVFESATAATWAESVGALTADVNALLDATDWSNLDAADRDPGMSDPVARDFIISGRQLSFRHTVEDSDRAISCFERALEMQPRSAVAYAYLAAAAGARLQLTPDERFLEMAEKAARQALELNPGSADAHRSLAGLYHQKGEFVEAVEHALQAVEARGPEERVAGFLGMTLEKLGRPERALEWLTMAQHWASLRGDYDALLGRCWAKLGDDARAESAFRRTMELRPDSPDGWTCLAELRLLQGKFLEARQILESRPQKPSSDARPMLEAEAMVAFLSRDFATAERLCREVVLTGDGEPSAAYHLLPYSSALARAQQALGNDAAARDLLQQSRSHEMASGAGTTPESLYRLAAISSSLGETENALEHLRRAIEHGWLDHRLARIDPRFDHIAGEPRFEELLEKVAHRVAELRRHSS